MTEPAPLTAWVARLATELQVEDAVDAGGSIGPDLRAVLAVARDASHRVARPAAPITTFLLGVALGRAGAGADLGRLAGQVEALLPPADPGATTDAPGGRR